MATETFSNAYASTLAAGIVAGDLSLSVASAAGAPAAGGGSQFRVVIEAEILIVTAVSGTTFTVTRGAEGTTPASHSSGVPITHVITAGAMANLAPVSAVAPFQIGVR